MIKIKPEINQISKSLYSGSTLTPIEVIWHGMHICVKNKCCEDNTEIIETLNVGHSVNKSYQIILEKKLIFGNELAKNWLAVPLLDSLIKPNYSTLEIKKEIFYSSDKIIILNCIDFLYGHSLLKLLNAQRHLENNSDFGLIVIVQKMLRWMVPKGVSEIWTVDIPLKKGQGYYPKFHEFVEEECKRFDEIHVSKAHSHPSQFNITKFTQVNKHDFNAQEFKITFVWREDRLWCNLLLFRVLRKSKMLSIALAIQNRKIRKLLTQIRKKIPSAKVAIAGLGTQTSFPEWIEDYRVAQFDEETERATCEIYAQSRIVIGVHGSNMLLPSAHAGMTIDLMPNKRWINFAQDILYQESDPRLAAFRYRYLPINTSISEIAEIAQSMIKMYEIYQSAFTGDLSS